MHTVFSRAALLLALSFVVALALTGGQAAVAPAGAAAQSGCPTQPAGLSPEGSGPSRFTMMVRINQQANVNAYTNFNAAQGGLGGYMRPQDIFVINTRFESTTPTVAYSLATQLRAAFPCNRIIGLNGLGLNPTLPGYAFSLLGHPAVFSLMSDFEPMDWDGTRGTDPGRPPWASPFKVAFPRIKAWNKRMAATAASNASSSGQTTGLIPIFYSDWNYGQIAQDLDKKNRRLGNPHVGPQSVQVQDACADGGATAYASRVRGVLDQYRYKFVTQIKKVRKKGKIKKVKVTKRVKLKPAARPLRSNLGVQISFSNTPNPNAGMAITKTSAATAAACTQSGLKQGAGAFFYFASDDSMRLLFQQPFIASLRPNTAASGASGGVKPPKPKK